MPSTGITFSLFALSFAILIQFGMGDDPLSYRCFNSEYYNSTSTYAENLKTVMHDLHLKTPTTGFAIASAVNPKKEPAYGLALCRGDVSSKACKACVIQASNKSSDLCPNYKGAILWYDYCFVKYTDAAFFGQIDTANQFNFYNQYDVKDPAYFDHKARDLLRNITKQVYVSPKLYGTGVTDIRESNKLYGLIQCTRDLSVANCKKCVESAISELPSCCGGKQGARVETGSCNIRYEIYPFFTN